VDGTPNEAGHITEAIDHVIRYKDHDGWSPFYVSSIGHKAIILGHPWLVKHNPEINWHTGEVSMTRCPESCGMTEQGICPTGSKPSSPAGSERARAMSTISTRLAEAAKETSRPAHLDDLIPRPYQAFREVFSKESFDELPDRKEWDHAMSSRLTPKTSV